MRARVEKVDILGLKKSIKRAQKQDRWIMGHTHLDTIKTFRSCVHYKRQDENRTDPLSLWMLLKPHSKDFPEGGQNWKLSYMAMPQQSTLVKASTY